MRRKSQLVTSILRSEYLQFSRIAYSDIIIEQAEVPQPENARVSIIGSRLNIHDSLMRGACQVEGFKAKPN